MVGHRSYASESNIADSDILCNRSGETLESHIWNLTKLLVLPDPGDDLLGYVVATCFPKIFHRLNHRLSKPYFATLKQVKIGELVEVPSHDFESESISQSQQTNDKLLLASLLLLDLSVDFPALTEQATRAEAGKPYVLYTKNTCWEFHQLLVKLLESFKEAVEGLSTSRGKPAKREAGSPGFQEHLKKAISYGYALLRLAQGSAISKHLKNLSPSLTDHRRQGREIPTMAKEDSEAMDSTMTDDDQDMDLLHIQPDDQPQSVWKSYLEWLMLILAYFNAVEILVQFVGSPHHDALSISIKILISPRVGQDKLKWKELLKNPKYFPDGPEMNNEAIIKNLSTGSLKPDVALNVVEEFLKIFERLTKTEDPTLDSRCLSPYIEKFGKLMDHTRWKVYIETIQTNIAVLEQHPNDLEAISGIDEAAHLLKDDLSIFKFFRDTDGQKFTGSVHCEGTLASLFLLPSNMLPQLEVIYITFILFTVRY